MRRSYLVLACSLILYANATKLHYAPSAEWPRVVKKDGSCPPVWTQVKAELNTLFMTGNQCNDLARAAIHATFHDCGSWDTTQKLTGGCDGSLVLGVTPDVELARSENKGLEAIAGKIKDLATKYGTSVADMVVFAGSAAIVLCPGGPKIQTFIGRKDSTTSAPSGGLPDVFDSASNLFNLFAKKGFSAQDLAALLGAHSTSTQKFVDPAQANKSQDSTPGQWDVTYYKETYSFATGGKKDPGVFVFASDSKLATSNEVGLEFQGFIGNQGRWAGSFASAMERMVLFGNDKSEMVDCNSALG
ncbi:versatile peroxidase VPL1 [Coniochaeta ligniaria NRRL 30616]|uniref:Peroxidase n=1 Tax=Coniochaeta ligniaria NRRL 30616 TaxID=1408157 RepID=A0A1J7JN58_9PEZI|nr:versatile peroxidase VPL1 [Coniochaeta ligniaria NRRL 30616]